LGAYVLNVPADLDVKIALGEPQMQGFLTKVGSSEVAIVIPPAKGWSGLLTAGDYRLDVECSRLNDLLDYTVRVRLDDPLLDPPIVDSIIRSEGKKAPFNGSSREGHGQVLESAVSAIE
jgi:hypothetical protein